jgi:hypothetical protein
MVRLRPDPAADAVLAAIDGVDDGDVEHDRTAGVGDWLDRQIVSRIEVPRDAIAIDVNDAATLVDLDKHPLVRSALEQSQLSSAITPARLDGAVIRLPGPVGRPITQAVSRALWEWNSELELFAYRSRLDDNERCWAMYDRCRLTSSVVGALSATDPAHREAVQSVATLFEIQLPSNWL